MCGRYSVSVPTPELAASLGAELVGSALEGGGGGDALPPRWNVAPTQLAPMLVARPTRRLGPARFGLVPAGAESVRAIGAKYVNLRAEGVASQQLFAESAATRRCLIPADAFYEWAGAEKGKRAPWLVRPADGSVFTFAGIYDVHTDEAGARTTSFAILTVAAAAPIAAIHGRMPLVVSGDMRDAWLSRDERDARAMLRAARGAPLIEVVTHRVSKRVGSVANDDPSLHDRVED